MGVERGEEPVHKFGEVRVDVAGQGLAEHLQGVERLVDPLQVLILRRLRRQRRQIVEQQRKNLFRVFAYVGLTDGKKTKQIGDKSLLCVTFRKAKRRLRGQTVAGEGR